MNPTEKNVDKINVTEKENKPRLISLKTNLIKATCGFIL